MAKVVEQQEAVRRHRFTVEEFHKMGEAGIFHEDDRVELWDGEVVEMPPVGWRHVWCVRMLNRALSAWTLRDAADRSNILVSPQDPFVLDDHGEPQPDLAIVKDPPVGRLPDSDQLLLAVEVADTSLAYDRNVKLPRYAEAGIPEAWLADSNTDRFEVHSDPGPDDYRKTMRFTRGERVESATLPGLTFDAKDVLPPPEPEPEG